MPHSYTSVLIHYVFSTKERHKSISPEVREKLWPYLGGIARENDMTALAIGGTDDHVHILVSLPSTLSTSKAIQFLKAGSSKWIHEAFPTHQFFAWQEGYGAFSVSISGIADTVAYINAQADHHKTRSFQEEFIAFLERHEMKYDERYVWG